MSVSARSSPRVFGVGGWTGSNRATPTHMSGCDIEIV